MLQKSGKQKSDPAQRLIVAITGASGAIYGVRLLELLRDTAIETHLIVSQTARTTIATETSRKLAEVEALADVVHANQDLGAACSSGSFRNLGVVVAPCSVKTMSEIATGVTANLISRSADVALKERRTLVVVPRETPLSEIHLDNMLRLTRAGAVVLPAAPGFYHRPTSVDDLVRFVAARILDHLGVEHELVRRWSGGERRG